MDQVTQIREKIDIVSLLQEFLPLKKAGRNFKAVCPFHTDKTPSLVVSPERQIWHCFGCGKGGDCFSFLMEYEHIEFPEALRMLAEKAGVELQNQRIDTGLTSKKEKLYAMNHLAAEFYHYLLTKHKLGKNALEYVTNRGIKPQTIKTYMLGFSPTGNSLVTYLQKKKQYSVDELFDAGLASRRGRDVVDFFQGRLMFPLYDHRGNIVGFSGRVLNSTEKTSKYINTRETLVYHKGLTFFGLNMAKESIKKEETAILVEGEFDVISSFQEGITNVVAVKGTALTLEQAQLLSRFCKTVQLCFDMDHAGQEALKRSLPLLEQKGLAAMVIVLPNGKDADESIKNDPTSFKEAIRGAVGVYDYLLEKTQQTYDIKSSSGKKAVGDELLPLFVHIENDIVKEHYLQLLSRTLGISYDSLLKEMEKREKEKVVRSSAPVALVASSREEKLEEYVVALLAQSPHVAYLLGEMDNFLSDYVWHIPSLGKVASHIQEFIKTHPQDMAKSAVAGMPQELLQSFDTCFLLPLPSFTDEDSWQEELQKTTKELQTLYIREKMKKISEEMSAKEKTALPEEIASLQEEFARLAVQLKK
ncbi:MAG TPA: DNA primase [Patescibacteria group bacterium]|nr:DNA primase [Patescibacteria group bacterium]